MNEYINLQIRRRAAAKQKRGKGAGHQIRSYIMCPEPRVIDHRSGVKTTDVEAVLNGDLDEFLTGSRKT